MLCFVKRRWESDSLTVVFSGFPSRVDGQTTNTKTPRSKKHICSHASRSSRNSYGKPRSKFSGKENKFHRGKLQNNDFFNKSMSSSFKQWTKKWKVAEAQSFNKRLCSSFSSSSSSPHCFLASGRDSCCGYQTEMPSAFHLTTPSFPSLLFNSLFFLKKISAVLASAWRTSSRGFLKPSTFCLSLVKCHAQADTGFDASRVFTGLLRPGSLSCFCTTQKNGQMAAKTCSLVHISSASSHVHVRAPAEQCQVGDDRKVSKLAHH